MPVPATTFLVCGCPKSGTTWVQLMLDQHPEISCAGESRLVSLFHKVSRLIEDHNKFQEQRNVGVFSGVTGLRGFPKIELVDEAWLCEGLIERLLERTIDKPGVRAIGDKTPDVAEHLEWLRPRLPRTKFIHVIRDGRDVAVSGWHHVHRTTEGELRKDHSAFRQYAMLVAQLWQAIITGARATAPLLPGRYLEVRYEELHERPDAALDDMLQFLGVRSEPVLRAACIARSSFAAATSGREPGQEDAGAFLRKGIVGDWRNWFDDALNEEFLTIAGPLLEELGYPTRGPTADPGARVDPVFGATKVAPQPR